MARTRADVPDAVWPADRLGVPWLDPLMQADACDMPFRGWGQVSRRSRMRGTWHFYVDDYKFTTVWQTPSQLVGTRAVNVVEPNYSTNDQMPFAVALWAVYRKRWLARYWQARGLRVFADLNVSGRWAALNRIGIPPGWSAFATRATDGELAALTGQLEAARGIAGGKTVLFVVYGGGPAVREFCRAERLVWFPRSYVGGGEACCTSDLPLQIDWVEMIPNTTCSGGVGYGLLLSPADLNVFLRGLLTLRLPFPCAHHPLLNIRSSCPIGPADELR